GRCTASKKQMNGSRKPGGKNLSAKHWLARRAVLSQKLLKLGTTRSECLIRGAKKPLLLGTISPRSSSTVVRFVPKRHAAGWTYWTPINAAVLPPLISRLSASLRSAQRSTKPRGSASPIGQSAPSKRRSGPTTLTSALSTVGSYKQVS